MGEHRLPKPPLDPGLERHIRESRLYTARECYGPTAPISDGMKMWAERYADDVTLLLAEIDRLRAALTPSGQTDVGTGGTSGREGGRRG